MEKGQVPRCKCGGLVKPDIVFFGEGLPMEFSRNSHAMAEADLVLIIGTSLTVYPFAALPDLVRPKTPRVLFNRERVGGIGARKDDVLELGPCDLGIQELAKELGWMDELNKLWEKIVGAEEVKKQRARQGAKGEELEEELEEELVEAITARVEGLELKGDEDNTKEGGKGEGPVRSEEKPEECEKEDEEALRGEVPSDTDSGKEGVSDGLKNHLEMHLHQKTGAIGEKYGDSNEPKAQGEASDQKPATERPEGTPADDKAEQKPVEGKREEGHDDTSKAQERL